jgi:hypothetical protein
VRDLLRAIRNKVGSHLSCMVVPPSETLKLKLFCFAATHVKTHKLLQVCKQVVTNLFTSCRQVVFALLVPSCCNKFGTGC